LFLFLNKKDAFIYIVLTNVLFIEYFTYFNPYTSLLSLRRSYKIGFNTVLVVVGVREESVLGV
jgi:hypothetical protein